MWSFINKSTTWSVTDPGFAKGDHGERGYNGGPGPPAGSSGRVPGGARGRSPLKLKAFCPYSYKKGAKSWIIKCNDLNRNMHIRNRRFCIWRHLGYWPGRVGSGHGSKILIRFRLWYSALPSPPRLMRCAVNTWHKRIGGQKHTQHDSVTPSDTIHSLAKLRWR